MEQIIRKLVRFYKQINDDQLPIYAAQASFFLIISAFPLIMLTLTMIQFVSAFSEQDLLNALLSLVPSTLDDFVVNMVTELYNKSSGTVISVTALTAVWSASKGVLAVERGLNNVYGTKNRWSFIPLRLICYFYTIAFLFIVLFSLGILVFGNRIQIFLENHIPMLARFSGTVISLRTLLALGILTFFFMALYTFFPNRHTQFKDQLPGALFSTCGWLIFSFCYSIYIDNFTNYSYMYGSLAAIVLLMLWLYFCMQILLIGAEINVFLINDEQGIERIHNSQ